MMVGNYMGVQVVDTAVMFSKNMKCGAVIRMVMNFIVDERDGSRVT